MITTKTAHLNINDIKVPRRFKHHPPAVAKVMERYKYYNKTGSFDRDVIVDKDNNLLDGYTVYLVCKALDIDTIRCVKVKSKGMTANDYQQEALRTAGTDNLLLNGVMGLNGEAGECIDLVKKCAFQGHSLDPEKLAKELGDVAWYLAVTAYAIGYNLDDVLRMNIRKLKERYPEGFDADRSVNRKDEEV